MLRPTVRHSLSFIIIVTSAYLWLYSPLFHIGRFLSFLIHPQSVGLLGRGISPSQVRYLHRRTTQTQNKRTQISMPPVGFETMIRVFEQAKTVHASDSEATVIGLSSEAPCKLMKLIRIRRLLRYERAMNLASIPGSDERAFSSPWRSDCFLGP
jgi:hypothetical protein